MTTIDPDALASYVDRVRGAYRQLTQQPGELVSLTDLRPMVGGYRPHVDAALLHLHRQRQAVLIPESNQKTLTTADRDAAIVIGDQAKHSISIG